MMNFLRIVAALLLLHSSALAQGVGQLGAGQVWGNPSAARAPAAPATITALFDRAFGSTRGAILERGVSAWVLLAPGTAGLPFVSAGAGADPSYAILGLSGGGTNANLTASLGGIFYSTGTAGAILAGTATAGQMLRSGASAAPTWSTATWPNTAAQGDLLFGSATNVFSALAKDTNATRYLSNTGTSNSPAWAQVNLTNGVTGALPVANGGTAASSASGTALDNITGFASTGIMSRTGAGAYSFSTLSTLIDAIGATRGSILYRGAAGWAILTPGTATFALVSGGAGADPLWAAAGTGTVTSVTCNGGLTGGTFTTTGTCAADIASGSAFMSGTASKLLDAAVIYQAEVTTTFNATQTLNFNSFVHTQITLTANITSFSCSNQKAGQAGAIRFIQDATGSRTLPATMGCNMKFAGGTQPVLSTAANAVDVLAYDCVSSSYCVGNLIKDVK